jgi:hypothetical protein
MAPLDKIKNWFLNLSAEHQYEVAALTGHFHFDIRIDRAFGKGPKIQLFLEYLNTEGLEEIEIVKRTLFITKLIDFSFDGRDSEGGWTETLDRLLAIRTKLTEENKETDFIDKQLDAHQERKEIWLTICGSWEQLKNRFLTDKQIAEWYFLTTIRHEKK